MGGGTPPIMGLAGLPLPLRARHRRRLERQATLERYDERPWLLASAFEAATDPKMGALLELAQRPLDLDDDEPAEPREDLAFSFDEWSSRYFGALKRKRSRSLGLYTIEELITDDDAVPVQVIADIVEVAGRHHVPGELFVVSWDALRRHVMLVSDTANREAVARDMLKVSTVFRFSFSTYGAPEGWFSGVIIYPEKVGGIPRRLRVEPKRKPVVTAPPARPASALTASGKPAGRGAHVRIRIRRSGRGPALTRSAAF